MEVLRALYVCGSGLRFSGRSRHEYTPHTTHTTASLLEPELPRTREESNARPRDCRSRRAHHETTSKSHFASNKIARRHKESASTRTISAARARQHANPRRGSRSQKTSSFCTSTTPIPAEGCAGRQKSQNSFCTSTTPIPAEGSSARRKNEKKTRVFAPRPRRSPQRVARAGHKSQKTSSFCTSTTPIPAEGRAGRSEIAESPFDHADPRRGSQT